MRDRLNGIEKFGGVRKCINEKGKQKFFQRGALKQQAI